MKWRNAMKRLLMSIIVFLIILCAGTGCYEQSEETDNLSTVSTLPIQIETNSGTEGGENMNKNCRLLVNGKDISSENYVFLNYEYHYADLPLIAIVKALGGEAEWEEEMIATIEYNGKQYILNAEQYALVEKDQNAVQNFFAPPPGAIHGLGGQIIGDEYVISSVVIKRFITRLGAKISIDYDASIVYIDTID